MAFKIQIFCSIPFISLMFGIGNIVDVVDCASIVSASQNQNLTARLLTNFPLSPGAPILLNMAVNNHRFGSIAGIRISTNNGNPTADFSVLFYKGHCNAFKYKRKTLPDSSRDFKPFSDARVAVNYYYGDYPLYVAGGNSTITYFLSSTNGPTESVKDLDCQLELFLFNNKSSYDKFIDDPVSLPAEGYLKKSGCLPVGKGKRFKNSTVTFSLTEPNSYFVAISSAQDILTHIRIRIQALEFDTKGLNIVDCALTSFTTSCEVSLDDSGKETVQRVLSTNSATNSATDPITASDSAGHREVCVWANASHYVSINATIIKEQPGVNSNTMVSTCFCIVAALVLLGLLLCICAIGLIVTYQVCFLLRPHKHQKHQLWWHVDAAQDKKSISMTNI